MTGDFTAVTPRIGQLVRLLASDQDGEVVAAARALGRTLASVNEDFHSLAATIERTPPAPAYGAGPRPEDTWRAMARRIGERVRMNAKEQAFVLDMMSWPGEPSERQQAWLRALSKRAG